MIHKHVTMRDLLRDPQNNLPQKDETVFVHRQAKSGPQVFALNVASLGTPVILPAVDDTVILSENPIHNHKGVNMNDKDKE